MILSTLVIARYGAHALFKERNLFQFVLVKRNLLLKPLLAHLVLLNILVHLGDLTLDYGIAFLEWRRRALGRFLLFCVRNACFQISNLQVLLNNVREARTVSISKLVYFILQLRFFRFHTGNRGRFLRVKIYNRGTASQGSLKGGLLLLVAINRISFGLKFSL